MHFRLFTFDGGREGGRLCILHFVLSRVGGRGRLCILDFVLSRVGGRGRLCILDFALSRVGGRGRCSAACVFHATLHLTLTSFFVIQFHFFLSELQNNAIQAVTGKLFGDSGSSVKTL